MKTILYALIVLSSIRIISGLYALTLDKFPRIVPWTRAEIAWWLIFRSLFIGWMVWAICQ